jgi:hypothetical protein
VRKKALLVDVKGDWAMCAASGLADIRITVSGMEQGQE